MIFPVVASIKDIFQRGTRFPWPRPKSSPQCGGRRLWGHGYVPAYFDESANQDLLRRFGLIHDLVANPELDPGEQEGLLREKYERKWAIPFSDKTRITRSPMLRRVKRYSKRSLGRCAILQNRTRWWRSQSLADHRKWFMAGGTRGKSVSR
jgi:hypothetical protein